MAANSVRALGGVMQQQQARNGLILSVGAALCCVAARGALANRATGSPATTAARLQIDIDRQTLSGTIRADPGSVRVTRSIHRLRCPICTSA
jgi:hypothetical protein